MRPEQSLLQVIEEQGYRLNEPYIDRARTTAKFDVVFLFFVIEIVTEILETSTSVTIMFVIQNVYLIKI